MSDVIFDFDVIEEVYDISIEEDVFNVDAREVFVVNSFLVSHIVKEIEYNELPYTLGIIPNGYLINKVIIKVLEEFDNGILTIGTDDSQGILTVADDCDLTKQATYIIDTYLNTTELTTYKAFYAGSSSKGKIRIIILYQ